MKKQIICISWGTKYGPPYVNRLYGMAARNITPPFSFTCFTDDPSGIRPEVRCEPLPPLDVAMPTGTFGKWPKARLWNPALADLTGPVLFMDLDVVITGSLDDFFTYGDPDDVILARNPTVPLERLGQTSVYRTPVGKLAPLLETFRADPQAVADRYQWEQRFVTRNAPGGVRFWPRAWTPLFRRACARSFPLNYLLQPRLPKDARIVLFPGVTLPSDIIAGRWSRHLKSRSPGAHLMASFGRDRERNLWRHLRHYVKPTDWVREAWRE